MINDAELKKACLKIKAWIESPEGKLALERAAANTRAAMKRHQEASRLRPEILLKRYTDLT
jgi:hypothetical protein